MSIWGYAWASFEVMTSQDGSFHQSAQNPSRVKGSHHIFTLAGRQAALNLQPDGSKAKAYQVRQIRRIITEHKLTIDEDE